MFRINLTIIKQKQPIEKKMDKKNENTLIVELETKNFNMYQNLVKKMCSFYIASLLPTSFSTS